MRVWVVVGGGRASVQGWGSRSSEDKGSYAFHLEDPGTTWLLDKIEVHFKAVFKTWLAARDQAWREGIEVTAIDGLPQLRAPHDRSGWRPPGLKTTAMEEMPYATAVMDPFHVVHLAADALDECRRRTQHDIFGHRGRAADPLYKTRRSLHTGADLLTDRQKTRLNEVFADERHVAVEVTLGRLPAIDRRVPRPRRR